MQITIRQLKSLIREAIMNEGAEQNQQYSINFDIVGKTKTRSKKN